MVKLIGIMKPNGVITHYGVQDLSGNSKIYFYSVAQTIDIIKQLGCVNAKVVPSNKKESTVEVIKGIDMYVKDLPEYASNGALIAPKIEILGEGIHKGVTYYLIKHPLSEPIICDEIATMSAIFKYGCSNAIVKTRHQSGKRFVSSTLGTFKPIPIKNLVDAQNTTQVKDTKEVKKEAINSYKSYEQICKESNFMYRTCSPTKVKKQALATIGEHHSILYGFSWIKKRYLKPSIADYIYHNNHKFKPYSPRTQSTPPEKDAFRFCYNYEFLTAATQEELLFYVYATRKLCEYYAATYETQNKVTDPTLKKFYLSRLQYPSVKEVYAKYNGVFPKFNIKTIESSDLSYDLNKNFKPIGNYYPDFFEYFGLDIKDVATIKQAIYDTLTHFGKETRVGTLLKARDRARDNAGEYVTYFDKLLTPVETTMGISYKEKTEKLGEKRSMNDLIVALETASLTELNYKAYSETPTSKEPFFISAKSTTWTPKELDKLKTYRYVNFWKDVAQSITKEQYNMLVAMYGNIPACKGMLYTLSQYKKLPQTV